MKCHEKRKIGTFYDSCAFFFVLDPFSTQVHNYMCICLTTMKNLKHPVCIEWQRLMGWCKLGSGVREK